MLPIRRWTAPTTSSSDCGRVRIQGPRPEHPYGHSKYETLAAFVLSGLLFLTCFEIFSSALRRLISRSGPAPEVSALSFAVAIATMLVNIGVARYEARRGRELGSDFLLADAATPAATSWSPARWSRA